MANYINKYASVEAYEADVKQYPNVSLVAGELVYDATEPIGYKYLTFKVLTDGDVTWSGSTSANTLSYSTDGGATWTEPAQLITASVQADDVVMWKGECVPSTRAVDGIGRLSSTTATFDVEGNPMSLIYGDEFRSHNEHPTNAYYGLFSGCTGVVNAENFVIEGTLNDSSFKRTFNGCSNLTTAPALPATTLASSCYSGMFRGCTSLTTAPELPATTLEAFCYNQMFSGCTNLNYIKCLATDISAKFCTSDWTIGVAATGTFVKDANMTGWTTGTSGIPTNWTVQDYPAPTPIDYSTHYLTFTALDAGSFSYYSNDENGLVSYSNDGGQTWSTPSASVSISSVASGDVIWWRGTYDPSTITGASIGQFYATGNFNVEGNIMSLVYGDNFAGQTASVNLQSMFADNYYIISAENLVLPATTLTYTCYNAMFQGCQNLTTAPALPATTLATNCYSYMFEGCTHLTTAPELPASTLVDGCYDSMFNSCDALNYIKCLATDISATDCTANWVDGVAATGTFIKASSMSSWTTGTSGIPTGWSIENAS